MAAIIIKATPNIFSEKRKSLTPNISMAAPTMTYKGLLLSKSSMSILVHLLSDKFNFESFTFIQGNSF